MRNLISCHYCGAIYPLTGAQFCVKCGISLCTRCWLASREMGEVRCMCKEDSMEVKG